MVKLLVFFVTKDSYFKAKVDFRDELPRCSAKNKKSVKILAIIITFYVRNNRVFLASTKILIFENLDKRIKNVCDIPFHGWQNMRDTYFGTDPVLKLCVTSSFTSGKMCVTHILESIRS